jgi:hypothetical protein
VLTRQPPNFTLINDDTGVLWRPVVKRIALQIPYVKLSEKTFLDLEKQKLSVPRKMPVLRTRLFKTEIAQGISQKTVNNLMRNTTLPQKVIVGFVDNQAMEGQPTRNPYHFHHFGLNKITLYKNGVAFPWNGHQPDFAQMDYRLQYMSLLRTLGFTDQDTQFNIDYEEYGSGFTLFGFDLVGDRKTGGDVTHVPEFGEITFQLNFKQALNKAVTMLVFCEYEDEITINDKNVPLLSWEGS